MLWTTPESLQEQLPLMSDDRGLILTSDARLDNRDELIARLDFKGRRSEQITDSALILAAYERWGESCPEKLLGDFAFAIWDRRRQALYCARDQFGVKPFYYVMSDKLVAFSTQIKALLTLSDVPRRLNDVRIGDYLVVGVDDPAITIYDGIFRLLPGHCMTVNKDIKTISCYWKLRPGREIRLNSDREYAEALRELFIESVRSRMRSAFPIGSMLSGGMDSSSITCVARMIAREDAQPVRTLSAVFDVVKECDERDYQRAVVADNAPGRHIFHADSVGPLADLDRILWHLDEPVEAGNLYVNWHLYAMAQADGVRVVLDGFDGDSTIGHGLGLFTDLAQAGQWLRLASEIRAFAPKNGEVWQAALWTWYQRYLVDPVVSRYRPLRTIRRIARKARRVVATDGAPRSAAWRRLVRPDFARQVGLEERQRAFKEQAGTEREKHYRRLTSGGMIHSLELLDKAAAVFGIEVRFPFWDRRII
jgi:asparagine synthase (glutamine-hydrolysing)